LTEAPVNLINCDRSRKGPMLELCATIRQTGYKFDRWLDLTLYQLILPTPERPVDG
jgi:hypothetical protein